MKMTCKRWAHFHTEHPQLWEQRDKGNTERERERVHHKSPGASSVRQMGQCQNRVWLGKEVVAMQPPWQPSNQSCSVGLWRCCKRPAFLHMYRSVEQQQCVCVQTHRQNENKLRIGQTGDNIEKGLLVWWWHEQLSQHYSSVYNSMLTYFYSCRESTAWRRLSSCLFSSNNCAAIFQLLCWWHKIAFSD